MTLNILQSLMVRRKKNIQSSGHSSSGKPKTTIFGRTTGEHCGEMCKSSYLSDNSCPHHGMSCTTKSECLKSVKASCNCSLTLKCKEDPGNQKSETSTEKVADFLRNNLQSVRTSLVVWKIICQS